MDIQILRYHYRLRPSTDQVEKLELFASYSRGIWNLLLAETQRRYRHDKKFLFYKDFSLLLKELKPFEEFSWIKEMDSASAQQTARDLDVALRQGIDKSNITAFP